MTDMDNFDLGEPGAKTLREAEGHTPQRACVPPVRWFMVVRGSTAEGGWYFSDVAKTAPLNSLELARKCDLWTNRETDGKAVLIVAALRDESRYVVVDAWCREGVAIRLDSVRACLPSLY